MIKSNRISIDDKLLKEFKIYCVKKEMTMKAMVEKMIREKIKK